MLPLFAGHFHDVVSAAERRSVCTQDQNGDGVVGCDPISAPLNGDNNLQGKRVSASGLFKISQATGGSFSISTGSNV